MMRCVVVVMNYMWVLVLMIDFSMSAVARVILWCSSCVVRVFVVVHLWFMIDWLRNVIRAVVYNWLIVSWICYIWIFTFVIYLTRVSSWLVMSVSWLVVDWLAVNWLLTDWLDDTDWLNDTGLLDDTDWLIIVVSHTLLRFRVVWARFVAVWR